VHVGLVLPGFVATEGFPAKELLERRATRWIVSTPERVAEAIVDTSLRGKAERYVPRPYKTFAMMRIVTGGLLRRLQGGRAGELALTKTGAQHAEADGSS
jgi:short-subunit dehydrogenase